MIFSCQYLRIRGYRYLIEAVTSQGPVSHKRLYELEKLLEKCTAKRAYISAFLSYGEYRRHQRQIAWE